MSFYFVIQIVRTKIKDKYRQFGLYTQRTHVLDFCIQPIGMKLTIRASMHLEAKHEKVTQFLSFFLSSLYFSLFHDLLIRKTSSFISLIKSRIQICQLVIPVILVLHFMFVDFPKKLGKKYLTLKYLLDLKNIYIFSY